MGWLSAPEYWLGRLILERGIAVVYVCRIRCGRTAIPGADRRARAVAGAALSGPAVVLRTPSIFHLHYSDRFFAAVAWSGAALAAAMAAGLADVVPLWVAVLLWLLLWVRTCRSSTSARPGTCSAGSRCCWKSGFLAIFLGNDRVAPPLLTMWLARLLLFRLEFGAGLIKLRGDSCWRDLTCLYYHHETQPMPGPLSWFFHHLPKPLHRVEAAGNHFAQLVVPFGLFAPQPVASVAGGDRRGHPAVAGGVRQLRLAQLVDDPVGLQRDRRLVGGDAAAHPPPAGARRSSALVRRPGDRVRRR